MKNTDLVQLLRELADCADAPAYERVRTMNGDLRLLSTRARQAAEEIEGREVGPDLDDVIDQAWRLHQAIGYQGERLMYEQGFDLAVRLVLARFGGGEAGS